MFQFTRLAAAAITVSALLVTAPAEAAVIQSPSVKVASVGARVTGVNAAVLAQVNQVRAWHGLPAIRATKGACQRRAAGYLANSGQFRHSGCDSILAKGPDIGAFGGAWANSPAHLRLILQARSARIGVARDRWGNWVAVVRLYG